MHPLEEKVYKPEELMKFQLLAGVHTEVDWAKPPVLNHENKSVRRTLEFRAGDGKLVLSPINLEERLVNKFRRVYDDPTKAYNPVMVAAQEDELTKLRAENAALRAQQGTNQPSLPSPTPVVLPPSAAQGQTSTINEMSVEELRKFAEEEEIDLGRATRKEDVLKIIQKATSGLK